MTDRKMGPQVLRPSIYATVNYLTENLDSPFGSYTLTTKYE